MDQKIQQITSDFNSDIARVSSLKEWEELRIKYLGRNGLLTDLFEALKSVPSSEKPLLGKSLNLLRKDLEERSAALKERLTQAEAGAGKANEDLTLPGGLIPAGSKHLLIQTVNEIKAIFKGLGFSVHLGPEIESDFYNFGALNFADDHPARDMQDTFFVGKDYLLRTHTSPVQIRVMENKKPPIRAIMPGKVFRNEAVSARSYCLFHQVEGLYVDKGVTFAELKGTLVSFARQFYGSDLKYRFRSSFFPFTEPSAEMDITCYICNGKGCRICKHSGWIEILGCGMVDPNVFKSVGYDPNEVSGYAFGMGIERTTLLKYGITDIRTFFENDVRFLRQF